MVRIVAACVLAGAALVPRAFAAEAAPATEAARAPRTPPGYVSALGEYRAWREPDLVPWRRANDEVGRLGGHAGHLRGDMAPAPTGESRGDRPAEKR